MEESAGTICTVALSSSTCCANWQAISSAKSLAGMHTTRFAGSGWRGEVKPVPVVSSSTSSSTLCKTSSARVAVISSECRASSTMVSAGISTVSYLCTDDRVFSVVLDQGSRIPRVRGQHALIKMFRRRQACSLSQQHFQIVQTRNLAPDHNQAHRKRGGKKRTRQSPQERPEDGGNQRRDGRDAGRGAVEHRLDEVPDHNLEHAEHDHRPRSGVQCGETAAASSNGPAAAIMIPT